MELYKRVKHISNTRESFNISIRRGENEFYLWGRQKSAQVAHSYLLEASDVYALQHALLWHLHWLCWARCLRHPKQHNLKHGLDALGMLNEHLSAALMNSSIPHRSSQRKCTICATYMALKHPAIQFDAQSCISNGISSGRTRTTTSAQARIKQWCTYLGIIVILKLDLLMALYLKGWGKARGEFL